MSSYSRYPDQDPCAILLACMLLTKSSSPAQYTIKDHFNDDSNSPYDESFLVSKTHFQDDAKDRHVQFGNNRNSIIKDSNNMVNETVLYISKLCNAAGVKM